MATVTRSSSALPVAGDDINAEPITDQINNILTFLEATNIDEANVNLTGTTGIVGKSTAQTITGLKTFENTSAGAGGLRTVLNISQNPATGTSTDADGISIPFLGDDDAGTQVTYARLDILFDDTGVGSTDTSINFRLMQAGTARESLSLGSVETTFNEDAQDIDFRIETDTNSNAFWIDAGLFSGVGAASFGAAAVNTGYVTIDNPAFTAVASTNISKLRIDNTAAITVPAGTTAVAASMHVDEPNLTATGTITSAVTLYIEAAPTEGGTNNFALWVDDGASRFDGATTINIANANALAVGANGTTNPVLKVDSSVVSVATGINITGAAAASRVAIAAISSGTNEGLSIDAKGSGTIRLGATSTGAIEYSRDAVPTSNDGAALGTTTLGWADLFLATGGVINWANGEITITETDANTLTIAGVATRFDFVAGILEMNNAIEWDTGVAVVAAEYSVGRDADATNQLHFNVPTGASFEFSINDAAEVVLDATNFKPGANDGNALGVSGTAWADLFLASGAVIDFAAGDVTVTHSANTLAFAGAASGYTFDTVIYVNDTSNAFMTQGMTLNQGANDDGILDFKSSDVAHGMTSLAETDTYAQFLKASPTVGGLTIRGYTASNVGLGFVALGVIDATAKTTAANGYIQILAAKKSGTTVGDCGADANLAVIINNGTTRFIFDAEGSGHADVEWVAFDAEDDLQLVADIEAMMVPEIFGQAVKYREADMVRLGLFGKDSIRQEPNGKIRGMMNQTRMIMLHHGTLHKIYHTLQDQRSRIEQLEGKLLAERN